MPIYEGQTIEEATAQGLRALNLTREDAQITVVAEAKKGFLGLGKKMHKYQLSQPSVNKLQKRWKKQLRL